MSDLISRQAAIDALERSKDKTAKGDIGGFYNTIIQNDIDKIKGLPSARPERKKGRWINYKDEHCCSVCDWVIIEDCWDEENRYDYCPYCGADMRGEENE